MMMMIFQVFMHVTHLLGLGDVTNGVTDVCALTLGDHDDGEDTLGEGLDIHVGLIGLDNEDGLTLGNLESTDKREGFAWSETTSGIKHCGFQGTVTRKRRSPARARGSNQAFRYRRSGSYLVTFILEPASDGSLGHRGGKGGHEDLLDGIGHLEISGGDAVDAGHAEPARASNLCI